MEEPAGLTEWANAQVPEALRGDPIWRLPAYRYSLFLADQIQSAAPRLRRVCTRRTVDQLLDAAHSISSNIAEGYSRTGGPERAKFFEYANSSARETRDWLFKARKAFDAATADAYIELVTRVMKILTAVIPRERETPNTRARLPKRERGTIQSADASMRDEPALGSVRQYPSESTSNQHSQPADTPQQPASD